MNAFFEMFGKGESSLYICAAFVIAGILVIVFPLTIFEQKVVKNRWKNVNDFLIKNKDTIQFRAFDLKQKEDVIVPIFSGFLIHGHFTYLCLDPNLPSDKAIAFLTELKEVCLANDSWHLGTFTNRFYAWIYYRKAARNFATKST